MLLDIHYNAKIYDKNYVPNLTNLRTILRKYPNAILADVTSHATDDLKKLSPFYPHGGIPVPFSEGVTAMCVETVWQGA